MTLEETPTNDAAGTPGRAPVLTVIQHDEDVPLDRFAGPLAGLEIRTVRAWAGDTVPTAPTAGLLVLGGRTNAWADDAAPWLPATRALLATAVAAGVPTLGICLGAQLLALAGGGQVEVAAPPGREMGVVDVHWRPEAAADPLLGVLAAAGRTASLPSMHADAVVDLPPGAVWLGSSDMYPYQAFRLGSAWGLQFHPEAGVETLRGWVAETVADTRADVDPEEVLAEYVAREAEISAAGRAIAVRFAALVRQSATRSSASMIV